MNNPSFSFSRQALIAALISTAFPLASQAAAGRVEFAVGTVNAVGRDGSSRVLKKGGEIDNGDTIQTAEGRAQIRFSDGGYISLQPNTEFKVEDYSYNGKPDGSEKGVFTLVKGGLRAITGAIGHTNKQAYRVNTPVATIGIRGTEYLAQYGGTKLLVKVGNGAVYLVNSAGDIVLYKGQVGEVGEGTKPQYSSEQPSVAAAGPAGGTPQETQEQQGNQEQEQIFLAGELRTADGEPCAISDTCFNGHDFPQLDQLNQLLQGPLANLSQLAALDAGAVYTATNAVTMSGASGSSTGTSTSALLVNFMEYNASFVMSAEFSSGALSGKTVHGGVDGHLNPETGGFSFGTGTTHTVSGESLYGTGSLNIHSAALNSANLSRATVQYSFTDGYAFMNSGNITAHMRGIAFPNSSINYPSDPSTSAH